MKQYYNKNTNSQYISGNSITIRINQNCMFSGYPTEDQLLQWGYEEVQANTNNSYNLESNLFTRMLEIKEQLKNMDYLTSKFIDGEDMSEYGDWLEERRALREEYRNLELEYDDPNQQHSKLFI